MQNRQREDYTIGWICVTALGLAAARSMLDEEHPNLPRERIDVNSYTLGSVEGHHVVVVGLPLGYYGTTSAAVAVRDMCRSFQSIRFALLVGIGGAIPTQLDVRLGDVVVGMPQSSSGGLIQFDFGSQTRMGPVRRTGMLHRPPAILLGALNALQSKHVIAGPSFGRLMEETLARNPQSRQIFSRPNPDRDQLYDAEYEHTQSRGDCSLCDHSKLISRPPRVPPGPVVHYGPIASSYQVVRHANLRDEIGRATGALCVEMEAAGIVDDLPCLVIRGIADYSDSHRTKEWQGYAAFAAAAYTKELLQTISTQSVESEAAIQGVQAAAPDDSGVGTSSTASTSSTLVGGLEEGVVDTAVKRVADILAADKTVRALCAVALSRMKPSDLQLKLIIAIRVLSTDLTKFAQSPLERGLRWVLNHYKPLIALMVTEAICKEENIPASLGLSLQETASISNERLVQILRDRFTAAQSGQSDAITGSGHSETAIKDRENVSEPEIQGSLHHDLGRQDIETQELDDELDPDAQEPPEPDTLRDLDQLDQLLYSRSAMIDVRQTLKNLLFPQVRQLIQQVLSQHTTGSAGELEITCIIKWELLQYVKYEDLDVHDIDHIFTLNGDFDRACAAPLGQYMQAIWGERGKGILDALKTALQAAGENVFDEVSTNRSRTVLAPVNETQIQLVPARIDADKEHALLRISGSSQYVHEVLEQAAWLAATLRLHNEGQMTVSYINFRTLHTDVTESSKVRHFQLSLLSPDQTPRPLADEMGQCWTNVFTQSVLAYGFPLPDGGRPVAMVGLEIPFDLMASFTGVEFPVLLGERLIFASSTKLLIPEITSGDSILWHFDTVENVLRQGTRTGKVVDPRLTNVDISKLRSSRAFLGYSKKSEVIIGTKDFLEAEVAECRVPQVEPTLNLKNEGPLGISVSAKRLATANIGTTWRFCRGESEQIKYSDMEPDDMFKRAATTPLLLYDYKRCIAFLVPELSLVVQMAATHLQRTSLLSNSKIPRAARSFDGGSAAYDALVAAKNLKIPSRTGEPVKYADIVKKYMTILEQRKLQKSLSQSFIKISRKKSLRGWAYADVRRQIFELQERAISTPVIQRRPVWWNLFKRSNTVVLFVEGTTYAIRGCRETGFSACNAWANIPEKEHLLLTTVQTLKQLKGQLCHVSAKYPMRFMLTDQLAWARPVHSRLFEDDCTQDTFCNPLQTIRKVGALKEKTMLWHQQSEFRVHPGELEEEGSVLFGSESTQIGALKCQLLEPDPASRRSDSKLFLRLSYLAAVLLSISIAFWARARS